MVVGRQLLLAVTNGTEVNYYHRETEIENFCRRGYLGKCLEFLYVLISAIKIDKNLSSASYNPKLQAKVEAT